MAGPGNWLRAGPGSAMEAAWHPLVAHAMGSRAVEVEPCRLLRFGLGGVHRRTPPLAWSGRGLLGRGCSGQEHQAGGQDQPAMAVDRREHDHRLNLSGQAGLDALEPEDEGLRGFGLWGRDLRRSGQDPVEAFPARGQTRPESNHGSKGGMDRLRPGAPSSANGTVSGAWHRNDREAAPRRT